MQNLLFDIAPLLETHWTGIPVYTARLARLLLDDPKIEPVFFVHGRLIETKQVLRSLDAMTGLYLRNDYERDRLPAVLRRSRIDKALFPSVKSMYAIAPSEASVVHDLTTIITPEYHDSANIEFHRNNLLREIESNDIVFATSMATADDISYYLDVPHEKIKVAHQFVDWPAEFNLNFESRYPRDLSLPYVLVIGTIEPRKNLRLVLEAIKEILAIDPELKIVIMGKVGWRLNDALAGDVDSFVAQGRLKFAGFVDEFKKYCLIRSCRFTIFPSLMEGFGIPVLESFDLGKPVLASFSSSIPEVGQEAAVYFDPLSKQDFVRGFHKLYDKVMNDPDLTKSNALNVAAKFTPENFFKPFRSWILK